MLVKKTKRNVEDMEVFSRGI